MILRINKVEPDDWPLAIQAARKVLYEKGIEGQIIKFDNGVTLWARKTKHDNITVTGARVYE